MKGKTGKSAMRGGGMARKGIGAALKGGGIARKGTGSNATPGGKVPKMAMGGPAEMDRGMRRDMRRDMRRRDGDMRKTLPAFPTRPGMPINPSIGSGKGGQGGGQTISQGVRGAMEAVGGMPTPSGGVKTPGMVRPQMGPENILVKPAPGSMMKKNGGKVSKYAKGGVVKMTAGAGSGSGRLEKVAAHKSAKRIPAANLKSGGKVKGK